MHTALQMRLYKAKYSWRIASLNRLNCVWRRDLWSHLYCCKVKEGPCYDALYDIWYISIIKLQTSLVKPQSMVRYQLRPGCSGLCSALQTSMEGDGTESLGYLLCYLLASQRESPSSQSAWAFFCFSLSPPPDTLLLSTSVKVLLCLHQDLLAGPGSLPVNWKMFEALFVYFTCVPPECYIIVCETAFTSNKMRWSIPEYFLFLNFKLPWIQILWEE